MVIYIQAGHCLLPPKEDVADDGGRPYEVLGRGNDRKSRGEEGREERQTCRGDFFKYCLIFINFPTLFWPFGTPSVFENLDS